MAEFCLLPWQWNQSPQRNEGGDLNEQWKLNSVSYSFNFNTQPFNVSTFKVEQTVVLLLN